MPEIGSREKLTVLKKVDFGLYLDGGDLGEILIPKRYVPKGTKDGDELDVFIYLDSEDRIIATTEIPLVEVGKAAHLEVVSTDQFGAFMNWGLAKDLLVPFKEQRVPMVAGRSYTVVAFIDVTGRITGSSMLSNFLSEEAEEEFEEKQKVTLQIASRSDLGYKAIINGTHLGLIHTSDLLQPINVGETMEGYIKNIREDWKIDLTLQATGYEAIDDLSKEILEFITDNDGSTDITDKSPPEIIYKYFKVSKGNYKRAIGRLLKDGLIKIEEDKITLVSV